LTRVITANLQANLSTRQTLADLRKILDDEPDVIGFQEIGGLFRAAAMRALLARRGYAFVRRTHRADQGAAPLAYRRRSYKRLLARTWPLSPATKVGQAGAGPATLRAKYATYALLENRATGEVEFFAVAHLAPSVYLPVRDELHAEQIRRLVLLLVRYRKVDARYLLGDMNTTDLAGRLLPLTDAGLKAGRPVATEGHRAIDWIFSDREGTRQAIRGLNTDHDALRGDFP